MAFVTTDNALYSIAFKIHTKTAESIEMPFGMISGLGPRNSVLRGGDDPRREIGNFGGKHVPDKPNTVKKIANWTGPCSGTRQGQTLDCKRWTSLLSAAKWGWDCTPRAKSDIYDCLVY